MAGKPPYIALLPLLPFSPPRLRAELRPWNSNPGAFPSVNRQARAPPLELQTLRWTVFSPSFWRRTLQSGKEFSAFDLAIGRAIPSPIHFDVGQRLKEQLLEQDITGLVDEPQYDTEDATKDGTPFWRAETPPTDAVPAPSDVDPPAPSGSSAPSTPSSPNPPLTASQRNKLKFKARRAKTREKARDLSENPLLKSVHRKRIDGAKASALNLDLDATTLPHTKRGWMGPRPSGDEMAEDEDEGFEASEPPPLHHLDTGLGGAWLGKLTIPILDSHRRIIALLGGTPRDEARWKATTDRAAALLDQRLDRIRLSDERLHHRRAQDSFPAIGRGLSHGGGQIEPRELCNNVSNTQLTDELLADPSFQRLAGFANFLFAMWAPMLFAFYQAQMALLAAWNRALRWNFIGSVFAACTFNFGPRVICASHLDFANLSWGWCALTALGDFDPDLGGHLILWDLRLVIRFPPGSTILLPSAIVRHSNVPIQAHERRSSFAQYTAAGLFRWVRNGFRTDEDFERSASKEEQAKREAEHERRWEEGMKMFSVIDDL
ncbi:hypothetical protein B0H14DRAFT_3503324 [Mycena olivaceomarginata]|nr:hypothetical protein B0H14DRAFT_3503324 [Mycena olivaceomarginata]